MQIINNHQLFGANKGSSLTSASAEGESLPVGTYKRKLRGPRGYDSHYGFTGIPTGTFTGTLTVWYSHLPDPDPSTEAHWFQDTDIGTITLATGTTFGRLIGNAKGTWVRFVVTVATGTLLLSLWVQNEC